MTGLTLSRTDINFGDVCFRRLHLSVNPPTVQKPIKNTPEMLQSKQVFNLAVQILFQGTVTVDAGRCQISTELLLAKEGVKRILNAQFNNQQLNGSIDVLERDGFGWSISTISMKNSIKHQHIHDAGVQQLLAESAGIFVNSVKVIRINPDFTYLSEGDYHDLFVVDDITQQVGSYLSNLKESINQMRQIAHGPLPQVDMGSHCKSPTPCPQRKYCESLLSEYPVSCLPRSSVAAKKLLASGITDIRDIPDNTLESKNHERVRRVTISGKPEILPGVAQILEALPYPRFYLDFETIPFAIPRWQGVKPYQQIPFQWSCHIEHAAQGKLTHHDFLDISGNDPRQQFAERLIDTCGENGPVVVYNKAFELRILRELAREFPHLASALNAIAARVFDLLPIVREYFYHPDQKGSWSIKDVLPFLAPELSYKDLHGVSNGEEAQVAYMEAAFGNVSDSRLLELKNQLLAYCHLDTFSMLVIIKNLIKYAKR